MKVNLVKYVLCGKLFDLYKWSQVSVGVFQGMPCNICDQTYITLQNDAAQWIYVDKEI